MLQVCEQAGVQLQVVPLTEAYWERVVAHSITEIKAGRTPNPDIMCNSRCGVLTGTRHTCVSRELRGKLVCLVAPVSFKVLCRCQPHCHACTAMYAWLQPASVQGAGSGINVGH